MSPAPAPLLTFETLEPERPKIKIDGTLYELAILSDFGLLEQSRIARLLHEAAEAEQAVNARPEAKPTGNAEVDELLSRLDAIPESLARRVSTILDECVELLLRAPEDVRARLDDGQKRLIVDAFTPAVMAATPRATNRPQDHQPKTGRSTSASSSRSSRPRTARATG